MKTKFKSIKNDIKSMYLIEMVITPQKSNFYLLETFVFPTLTEPSLDTIRFLENIIQMKFKFFFSPLYRERERVNILFKICFSFFCYGKFLWGVVVLEPNSHSNHKKVPDLRTLHLFKKHKLFPLKFELIVRKHISREGFSLIGGWCNNPHTLGDKVPKIKLSFIFFIKM